LRVSVDLKGVIVEEALEEMVDQDPSDSVALNHGAPS
jgi:hypothetical protein